MVLVLGSINLDLVVRVEALPRPGETRTGESFATHPGGKGANQALAARRAGATVALFGAVGGDAFAGPALALLGEGAVDLTGIAVADAATGVALIHVDARGENTITVVPGANARVSASSVPASVLGPETVVAMQLEIPLAEVAAMAHRAHASGARVILNAAPARAVPADVLSDIDVLVVNEIEAATLAPALNAPASPAGFATHLATTFDVATVVTLGAAGLIAVSSDGVIALPAPRVQVVDTVGAGDALVGALAAALDRLESWPRALREGLAAGSLACMSAGAQPAMPFRGAIRAMAETI